VDIKELIKSFNNTMLLEIIASAKYEKDAYSLANYPKISGLFKNFAEMEKKHAQVFHNLIVRLGGTPDIIDDTLYIKTTPGNATEQEVEEILKQHLRDEQKAIKLYSEYAERAGDNNMKEELKIILIEKSLHESTLKRLIRELSPWN
jgi:rubrerythrin